MPDIVDAEVVAPLFPIQSAPVSSDALKAAVEQDRQNRIQNTQAGFEQLCQINGTKIIPYAILDLEKGVSLGYRIVAN